MPTITTFKKEIEKIVGKKIETDLLVKLLLEYLKADIESIEGDEVTIKFEDTNRPDLWSAEGLARGLRNLLGLEKGSKTYKVQKSDFVVNVDDLKLKDTRKFIACAVVKNLKFDEESIKSIIQIQEKLDVSYGRKRKKTSIGIYDYNKIKPPIIYTTVEPNSIKFVPLEFQEELTPAEILEKHPKGIEYGDIIKNHDEYPILIDSENNVLSLPPIINSDHLGKVDATTKNVLVEVTGTDHDTVNNTLAIVATALAERGGELYSVKIRYKDSKIEEITPNLDSIKLIIKPSYAKQIIGLDLNSREIKNILEKMNYDIVKIDDKENLMEIEAPFYRKDIMHPIDIVEDITIGYGYNNIEPELPKEATIGKISQKTMKQNLMRDLLVGAGHQEINSFILTNKNIIGDTMNQEGSGLVELANPISANWNVMRNSLMPILMRFFAINKTVEFPQKIFEIGPVFQIDEKQENKVRQTKKISAAISHSKVNLTEIKSLLSYLLTNLGHKYEVKTIENQSFISGRCGEILVDNKSAGIIGEIHPKVLGNFGLETPVTIFEIEFDVL